jgi:hypothetical protein
MATPCKKTVDKLDVDHHTQFIWMMISILFGLQGGFLLHVGQRVRRTTGRREMRMADPRQTFTTDRSTPGHWRVKLDNPPINVIDAGMADASCDLVAEAQAYADLKIEPPPPRW